MTALTPQEAATLAAALDPSAAARADADEPHGTTTAHAEALLRETPHRRALLQLDAALAQVQRLVREIMEEAR
jgi:hypothetical protein